MERSIRNNIKWRHILDLVCSVYGQKFSLVKHIIEITTFQIASTWAQILVSQ